MRHWNNGTDHRHSKSCCDKSSPARRTMKTLHISLRFHSRYSMIVSVITCSLGAENIIFNFRVSLGIKITFALCGVYVYVRQCTDSRRIPINKICSVLWKNYAQSTELSQYKYSCIYNAETYGNKNQFQKNIISLDLPWCNFYVLLLDKLSYEKILIVLQEHSSGTLLYAHALTISCLYIGKIKSWIIWIQ